MGTGFFSATVQQLNPRYRPTVAQRRQNVCDGMIQLEVEIKDFRVYETGDSNEKLKMFQKDVKELRHDGIWDSHFAD